MKELLQQTEAENQALRRACDSGYAICSHLIFQSTDFQLLWRSGNGAALGTWEKSVSSKAKLEMAELTA